MGAHRRPRLGGCEYNPLDSPVRLRDLVSNSSKLRIAALGAAVATVGCSPNWDTQYSTDHLEIETQFSDPLCEGDLQRWEALVVDIEDNLGVSLEPGLGISLWDELDWPYGRWCPKWATGCYSRPAHRIYATFSSIEHELVHAVAQSLGLNEPFFDEGVAEALQSAPTRFSASVPSSNLGLKGSELNRTTAAHFVRWLFETYGTEPLRELLASKGDLDAFADAYGQSFAEVEARYFEEAPWSYPPKFFHEVPGVPMVGDRRWQEQVAVDCAGPDAYGRIDGIAIIRTLNIDTRGYYGLWTSADGLWVSRRQRTIVASEADALEQLDGDVSPDLGLSLKGGEVHVLELAPAEYEVWIADFGRDLDEAEIAAWWHQGPIPSALPNSSEDAP